MDKRETTILINLPSRALPQNERIDRYTGQATCAAKDATLEPVRLSGRALKVGLICK